MGTRQGPHKQLKSMSLKKSSLEGAECTQTDLIYFTHTHTHTHTHTQRAHTHTHTHTHRPAHTYILRHAHLVLDMLTHFHVQTLCAVHRCARLLSPWLV